MSDYGPGPGPESGTSTRPRKDSHAVSGPLSVRVRARTCAPPFLPPWKDCPHFPRLFLLCFLSSRAFLSSFSAPLPPALPPNFPLGDFFGLIAVRVSETLAREIAITVIPVWSECHE